MRAQVRGAGLVAPSQRALAPFVLVRPPSLDALREAVAEHPGATLVAGSTDVFAQIREGLAPQVVITLRGVPELRRIGVDDDVLRLGASVTHHAGCRSQVVAGAVPGLAAAWEQIATVRIRRSATLGGNVLARRFRYELPVVLGALGARLEFLSGSTVGVRDLWDVDPAELGCLTAAAVPTAGLVWSGYDRSLRPVTTLALALRRSVGGVAVSATVGSECTRPVTVTVERDVRDLRDLAGLGAELADSLPDSTADVNGPMEYRRHVAGVQIERLLARAAAEQAGAAL